MSDFNRLKELFETALSQPSGEREAFVHDACSDDPMLESDLASLLDAHDASSGFFERLSEGIIGPALSAIELDDSDDVSGAGRNVSHYELLERIGGGGMGVVYKAQDTRLGRTVALKFLPRRHADNPSARARLLAEAKAASALDHPNIGVVYEIAEADDGRPFIAMAWYDGETLKDKIRGGPLSVSDVVTIVSQLASALAAAHKAGIIHRDIKPANVIVTQSGSVKLLDFGIAKLMSADDRDAHVAAGTVAYMSPEQTANSTLDARTDIWSLGVLIYEILSGQRPFKRDSDDLVLAAIRGEAAPALTSLRPEVPPAIEAIVERCLSKNAAGRFQTTDEFSAALREAQFDNGRRGVESAKSITTGIEPASAAHRRGRAVAAAALLAALAAGGWVYSRGPSDTARETIGSEAQPVSIAVLPFKDSTNSDSSGYLAVGLADEVRVELLRVRSVTVPDFVTSRRYEGSARPDSQIAKETGSSFLITGTMKGGAATGRLDIRLVDGKTGRPLWVREYDARTPARMHFVRNVAAEVLSTLGVRLTPEERGRLSAEPTGNAQGYDLYLRGRYAELSATPQNAFNAIPIENIRQAQALYAQARTLDPDFGPTRARLALSHMNSAGTYDTTRARLDQARVEAEIALRLDSSLSDAHDALSQYWSRDGNQQKAAEELEVALGRAPNNVGLLFALGTRMVRAGRWEEGLAHLDRALLLDPRNPNVAWHLAVFNGRLRRNEKSLRLYNRLIEISPEDNLARIIKGHSFLRWKGSADTLAAEMRKVPLSWDNQGMATYGRYTALRVQRRYREGLEMLDRAPADLSWDTHVYHPKSLMRADMYAGLGDSISARRNYDIARRLLLDSLADDPNAAPIHSALGLAYAGLGRKREAIAEAERAMQIAPISKNSPMATAFMGTAIETFAKVGERDRALQMIELLLSMPSGREVTVPFLRVWPGFDPLRSDPRFAQLLERFTVR
ncbi:MAG TPA: protein kinase [Gemmatimonadaceae bacterium]|nr:protein kinase [Gemmatimonadaceae bacterium]